MQVCVCSGDREGDTVREINSDQHKPSADAHEFQEQFSDDLFHPKSRQVVGLPGSLFGLGFQVVARLVILRKAGIRLNVVQRREETDDANHEHDHAKHHVQTVVVGE